MNVDIVSLCIIFFMSVQCVTARKTVKEGGCMQNRDAKLAKFCKELETILNGYGPEYNHCGIEWYSVRSDNYESLKKKFGVED